MNTSQNDKVAVYQSVYDDVSRRPACEIIENILRNNCFANGNRYFTNIIVAAAEIVDSMLRGERVVGVFEKAAQRLDNTSNAKAIERSVRCAIKTAWQRAAKSDMLDKTTILSMYPVTPTAGSFLRDVANKAYLEIKARIEAAETSGDGIGDVPNAPAD